MCPVVIEVKKLANFLNLTNDSKVYNLKTGNSDTEDAEREWLSWKKHKK